LLWNPKKRKPDGIIHDGIDKFGRIFYGRLSQKGLFRQWWWRWWCK
jgi:hypothetical protein